MVEQSKSIVLAPYPRLVPSGHAVAEFSAKTPLQLINHLPERPIACDEMQLRHVA